MTNEQIKTYYKFLKESGSLDEAFYMKTYEDLKKFKEQSDDLLLHYLKHGEKENRRPNAEFNPKWYRETYKDVAQSGMTLLYHYVKHEKSEGRKGRTVDANNTLGNILDFENKGIQ